MWIRDLVSRMENSDPGFGMEKSRIRDKHSGSAIQVPSWTSRKRSVLVLSVRSAVSKDTITDMETRVVDPDPGGQK